MSQENEKGFVFEKINYMLLAGGLVMVIIGFFLMSGGGSDDPAIFNPEVFSARRITVAPTVVLMGFAVVMIGIFKRPKAQ
ncbi:MAG: DUF3098 domain-containing protein [Salibacteraceae bacterium]|jgi:hypothetical protein|nr:DUF3098 domain-containing protein [Salibacteraceae bacterium]|tara:strand:+ start:31099 stop:31338 length:240 start_codon:yes stop_codon:yes gene_type:complete